MTQRSKERTNNGKRAASMKKAYNNGVGWGRNHSDIPIEVLEEIIEDEARDGVPNLKREFIRGVRDAVR